MPTIKELKQDLASYKDEDVVAYALWGVADVFQRARELRYKCTKEQAEKILERVHDNQDCEYGITWPSLDFFDAEDINCEKLPPAKCPFCGDEVEDQGQFDDPSSYYCWKCQKEVEPVFSQEVKA